MEVSLPTLLTEGSQSDLEAWLDGGGADRRLDGGAMPAQMALYMGQGEKAILIRSRMTAADWGTDLSFGDRDALAAALADRPEKEVELSGDGFAPLCLAAFFGHQECAALLLAAGADPNQASTALGGVHPLDSAAAANATEIAQMLLDAGADPNQFQAGGFRPIHGAAQNGNADLVRSLISFGADRLAKTDDGKLPVDFAPEGSEAAAFLSALG